MILENSLFLGIQLLVLLAGLAAMYAARRRRIPTASRFSMRPVWKDGDAYQPGGHRFAMLGTGLVMLVALVQVVSRLLI